MSLLGIRTNKNTEIFDIFSNCLINICVRFVAKSEVHIAANVVTRNPTLGEFQTITRTFSSKNS